VNVLQRSLEDADRRLPLARKLLVCRDRSEGRELLRALALRTGGWIGWEPSTLRAVADELALVPLADRGLRVLGDVEVAAAVDAALDHVLVRPDGAASPFAVLADGRGFRSALADSVLEMRMAGVAPERLRREAREPLARELASVYDAYLAELRTRRGADPAAVFDAALAGFEAEWPYVAAAVFLVPGLRRRGLPGRLLARLLGSGAELLDGDLPLGLQPPDSILVPADGAGRPSPDLDGSRPTALVDPDLSGRLDLLLEPSRTMPPALGPSGTRPATVLGRLHAHGAGAPTEPLALSLFRASSPAAELREVLRRVIQEGRRWDEVEIIASDPIAYGCALDVLAGTLGIPVTYAVGLPLERSRVGRALRAYLGWLEGGFHARPLVECLMRGEISPPSVDGGRPWASGVARRLRKLGIGWGAERYPLAIATIDEDLAASREAPERDPAAERERRERLSARRLLEILTAAIPPVLAEGQDVEGRTVSASAVAAGALRFLDLVRARRGSGEEEALLRSRERLEQIAAAGTLPTTLAGALADVRAHLMIRIPRPGTVGPLPWSSTAGALHLADLPRGGRTGRPRSFLVGLDSERIASAVAQDPFLPDPLRAALGEVPGTAERVEERRWDVAGLLAALRGEVTLSYAAWDAATGSALAPDPVLLQALRAQRGDPALTFRDLDAALGPAASPVPAGAGAFDGTDVWLRLLAGGRAPRDGEALVRLAFQGLDAGLRSVAARDGDALTPFHGWMPGAAVLDPSRRADRAVSPSELERAGRCPLSWFYHYALHVRRPDDPRYEPGRWLDPLARGALLHTVYERFGRAFASRQDELRDPAAEELLAAIVEEELALAGRRIPPPSPIARERESREIHRSARLFLEMEREFTDGSWLDFEVCFGQRGLPPPQVTFGPLGRVPVHGRIDRVDRLHGGGLRVIDYKTGIPRKQWQRRDPFDGGRILQSGLYVKAVEQHFGEPVVRFEYRYPTERGETRIQPFTPDEAEGAVDRAADLLSALERGSFLATDRPDDCKWCEQRSICRVTGDDRVSSPRARWSRDHRDLPPYETMVRLRDRT
jgi:ATP-dependent helicase/nuclease subunit B